MAMFISWALLGESGLVGIGYLARNWRDLTKITAIIGLIVCIPFLYLIESPKFYLGNKRMKKFGETIKYIAKTNDKKLDKFD